MRVAVVLAIDLVEIHAEDDLRLADEPGHFAIRIVFKYADVSDIGHPFKKVGIAVRCDTPDNMPQTIEIGSPCQSGSDGVTVRIGVG